MRQKRKPLVELVIDPDAVVLLPRAMDLGRGPNLEPGKLLRMLRTILRMTVTQLAQRSGVEQAHITRMEGGKVDGQWKTWARLFAALGCRLVPRLQMDAGLEGILEERIRLTAKARVARGERLFPSLKPLSAAELQAKEQEWMETLRGRHTSEIWDEQE